MSIGERLRVLIDAKYVSLRAFSDCTGIPYRTLQDYLRDMRAPGADALAHIGRESGVNLYWLLTGEGPMWQPFSPSPARGPDIASVEWTTERRFLQGLGIGEMALMASQGHQEGLWHILAVLTSVYPNGLSVKELREHLIGRNIQTTEEDIAAALVLLLRTGNVRETRDSMSSVYFATAPTAEIHAAALPDASQATTEAIETLVRVVLPAAESQPARGVLLNMQLNVPVGRGREFVQRLTDVVKREFYDAAVQTGPESVAIVLGIAVADETT